MNGIKIRIAFFTTINICAEFLGVADFRENLQLINKMEMKL